MKRMKKLVCGALSLASVCAFGLGLALTASAEDTTTIEATAFEMQYGASVRTADPAGIRFTALVGSEIYKEVTESENKSFGMFIVPDSYMDEYETYIKTDTDYEGKYYEYLKEQKKMIDFTYEADQLISQNDGYVMRGAITDVLFENLTRKFVGVAYIKTTTESGVTYEYADFTRANNARSISYVASAAINAGKGTTALEDYLEQSAYNLLGVTYNAETQKYTYGVNEYATLEEIEGITPSDAYSMSAEPLALNIGKSVSVATKNMASIAVTYESSDESVVTVSERGAVTALKEGTATITAKAGIYTSTRVVNAVPDYYEFGADEFIYAKDDMDASTTADSTGYTAWTSAILGKTGVYSYEGSGNWANEIVAKDTAYKLNGEAVPSATVKKLFEEKGYQYIAIDFALPLGNYEISLINTIPKADLSGGDTGGLTFKVGSALAYRAPVDTDEEKALYAVFSKGKQVEIGDTIESYVWYTAVVKLQTETDLEIYRNVGFSNGNVRIAGGRYYTNDSWKDDYIYSYEEFGADELVDGSGTGKYNEVDGEVFGKTGVYRFDPDATWKNVDLNHTIHYGSHTNKLYTYSSDVVNGANSRGWKYVAMDFALAKGDSIFLSSYIAGNTANSEATAVGGTLYFAEGSAPIYNGYKNYVDTDTEKGYFSLYSEGREIEIGGTETLKVGVWYTVVVKLQLGDDITGQYRGIGFASVNNAACAVYVGGARYYVDDSFKTEYTTLADYYEYGASEMVDVKMNGSYSAVDDTIYGKESAYSFTGNGWTNQIDARKTTHTGYENGSGALCKNAKDVRGSLITSGFKYVAIDFALSEGSAISVLGAIPYTGMSTNENGGLDFVDGGKLAYRATTDTDEEKAFFVVYANGEKVEIGDTIQAGVWYTVVVKLQLDVDKAKSESSYVNVGFGASGNSKPIYISTVRYYTNDTYTTDYASSSSDSSGEEISPEEPEAIAYTEYFFDSAAGNDGNDGLSASAPKASLAAAVQIASTASETNPVKLFFKKGSTFEGKAIFEGYQSTNAFPLILDSYGEGTGYPKFVGTGSETTKNTIDAVLYFKDDNVWVKNLEVTGPTAYQGIAFQPSSGGAFENVLVEGNYVHDINFNWTYSTQPSATSPDDIDVESVCPEGDGTGRYVYRKYSAICLDNDYTSAPAWFENVWIRNNRVENVGKIGINVYNRWNNKGGVGYGYNKYVDGTETYNDEAKGLGNYPHKNVYVTGNYLSCCGGDGLVVSGATGGKVDKNVSYYANYLGRTDYYNAGIWVFACTGTVVEYNEAAYTYMRNGGQDAQGFDIDNACRNIIFRYNYAHHNEGGGLLLCNNTTTIDKYDQNGDLTASDVSVQGDWGDNYIYGNVFAYNGKASDSARSAFITVARAASDAYIYNNTVVMSGEIKGQSIVNVEVSGCTNHYYYNNLFYSEAANGAKFNLSSTMAYRFEGNLFYNVTTSGLLNKYNFNAVSYDPELTGLDGLSVEDLNGFEALYFFVPENLSVSVGGSALPEKALAVKSGVDALGNEADSTHIGALVG